MVQKNVFNTFGKCVTSTYGTIHVEEPIESNSFIQAPNFLSGFVKLVTTTDTTLTTNSSGTQYYSGTGKTYFLPVGSTGLEYEFINEGTGDLVVKSSSGGDVGIVLPGMTMRVLYTGTEWYVFGGGGTVGGFMPTLYSTGPSTYTSQVGSYATDGTSCSVNCELVVASYDSDANACTFPLPLPSFSSRRQYVALHCLQGGTEYSVMTGFGVIEAGSMQVDVRTNFSLMPGDLWMGNFTYCRMI